MFDLNKFIGGNVATSGIPSNAIYDLSLKIWQNITNKTWEELYLDAFDKALKESKPYLKKYTCNQGKIEVDKQKIELFIRKYFCSNSTKVSGLTNDNFISELSLAMEEDSILILGGNQLTSEDYQSLIRRLIEKATSAFKESISSNPQAVYTALLEESLGIENTARKNLSLLEKCFSVTLPQLDRIESKVDSLDSVVQQLVSDHISNSSLRTNDALKHEYQAQLRQIKELIRSYKPKQAFRALELLRERIDDTVSSIIHYEILVNMGAAKLSMNHPIEAAGYLINALERNANDENAWYNAALGHILLQKDSEAQQLIDRILAANPASKNAYELIVLISTDETLDNLVEQIPVEYRHSSRIAYGLSHIARLQANHEKEEYWLQVALEDDPDNFEIQATYGTRLLESVSSDHWIMSHRQFSQENIKTIQKSENLLTLAWEKIRNTELRDFWSHIIMNRSIARRNLNRLEEAIQDSEVTLNISPNNPSLLASFQTVGRKPTP